MSAYAAADTIWVIASPWTLRFEDLSLIIRVRFAIFSVPSLFGVVGVEGSTSCCVHVLEFLERLAFEHIELILQVPERSGILAIDKVSPCLLTSQSAFLVNTRSVDEAVEV